MHNRKLNYICIHDVYKVHHWLEDDKLDHVNFKIASNYTVHELLISKQD